MELPHTKLGSEEHLHALPPLTVRLNPPEIREHDGQQSWGLDLLERRIRFKFDSHILPWVFLLWFLAFLDRGNIGNARVAGLGKALDLSGTRFNTAITVFHALYIVVNIPSNWLLKYIGGGRYLPILAGTWGIIAACIGTVESFAGLVICRLLLGAFEGAFFGGIVLYLSMFYKRHELMSRIGILSSAASLSGAFGGLLASGLSQIDYGGYSGWPWIFFIEGAVTVLVAIIALFFLPNTPSSAKFLSAQEQWLAAHRLFLDSQGATSLERVEQETFSWRVVRFSIVNVNTLLISLSYFLVLISVYSFAIFLPSILMDMGYDSTTAQLLTAPPNILAFLSVIASALLSDHIGMRGALILVGCSIAAMGYSILVSTASPSIRYVGLFFVGAGIFPCPPLLLTWLSNNLAPHYARATGLGFITAVGQFGAIVASFTYLERDEPSYTVGHSISLGAIGLAIVAVSLVQVHIRRENAARIAGKRDYRVEPLKNRQNLGHLNPSFRYTF